MHAVIVVPGIMGTELYLPDSAGAQGEKVWPPEPLETQFGYKRRDKLADPRLLVGDVITNVLCFQFYEPLFDLLTTLGFSEGGRDKRLVKFPYDWRRDLVDTTAKLASELDAILAAGAKTISLVAHSMGGLICRLLLENDAYRTRPWFSVINQLVAIATPHLGAPLALARILGLDSAMGISGADFAWLSSRPEYPSAYQLLPPPGEGVCWNQSDLALHPLDIYDPAVAGQLGLSLILLQRVRAIHAVLERGRQPTHVRYFYAAGTGHRTATRVNVFAEEGALDLARSVTTLTEDGGDGTVPLYSALPRLGQRHLAPNEHTSAFRGASFAAVCARLFGVDQGPALEGLAPLALSIERPVVTAGDTVEVLLAQDPPDGQADGSLPLVDGDLVLRMVRAGDVAVNREVRRASVHYAGPPLGRLRVYLDPVQEPGHYILRFEGRPNASRDVAFSVCTALPRGPGPGTP